MEYLSSPESIVCLQQIMNPALDVFFKVITWLGNEMFFIIFIPIIYWCIDKRFALKLAVFFLMSAYINDILKSIFQIPRPGPGTQEEGVKILLTEHAYAFPSGHSQNAVVFWGIIAWELKKAWVWIAAIALMLLIGVSRPYLAVHWPMDVVGGLLIGAVILGVYMLYDAKIDKKEISLQLIPQVILIIAAGIALFLLQYFVNSGIDIEFEPGKSAVAATGTFVGLAIGYLLEKKYIDFTPRSVWWYQIIKVLVGLVVAFALKEGLKAGFNLISEGLPVFSLIRYSIMGFWIAFCVPAIFRGRKG